MSFGKSGGTQVTTPELTPEQRQQIMNNDPIQRSLFPSSSPTDSDNITDWTKNNIGTFKQFVERFYT